MRRVDIKPIGEFDVIKHGCEDEEPAVVMSNRGAPMPPGSWTAAKSRWLSQAIQWLFRCQLTSSTPWNSCTPKRHWTRDEGERVDDAARARITMESANHRGLQRRSSYSPDVDSEELIRLETVSLEPVFLPAPVDRVRDSLVSDVGGEANAVEWLDVVGSGVHDVRRVHDHIAGLIVGNEPSAVMLFGERREVGGHPLGSAQDSVLLVLHDPPVATLQVAEPAQFHRAIAQRNPDGEYAVSSFA